MPPADGDDHSWDRGDPSTVRPGEPVRDVVDRLREQGEGAPATLHVTTADGHLVGTVDTEQLRAMSRADELP